MHYHQARRHEQKNVLSLMEAKLALLKDLGHMNKDGLTQKGRLAKSVSGYELLLAELYERNFFDELDEIGLGVIAAATVFEPRKNQHPPGISKKARGIKDICEAMYDRIRHKESRHRIYPLSKAPHFHLAGAMEAWMRGGEFSKILQYTDSDEGEVVRYFRMSLQILREIHDSSISSHTIKDRISKAIRLINRGIVDAEKQLREG